jgi:hypothetical protein
VSDETRTTVEILRAARHRIESPRRWCRRTYALTGNNRHVHPTSPKARKWCALGALDAECWGRSFDMAIVYLSKAVPLVSDLVLVSTVNDRRGHAAVLAVYDEAIRLAEEAPGPAGVAGG